jgi:hypothetical protein
MPGSVLTDNNLGGLMNTLSYKDYAIIAAAKRDETTGTYKPLVHIAWQTLGGRRKLSFSLPERCATFQEASALALGAAKNWTDNQPNDPGRESRHTRGNFTSAQIAR